MSEKKTPLGRDEIVKTNKYRYERLYTASLQSESVVLLSIGLHFEYAAQQAFPVISGSEWISHQEAITLLKECVTAMEMKLLEDQLQEDKKNKLNG